MSDLVWEGRDLVVVEPEDLARFEGADLRRDARQLGHK